MSQELKQLDMEKRVNISLSLQRYARAKAAFEQASNEFNEACQKVRETLPRDCRFVANLNHEFYLVTVDDCGNFQVEQVANV